MFKIHKFFDVIQDNLDYRQAAKVPKITFHLKDTHLYIFSGDIPTGQPFDRVFQFVGGLEGDAADL